MFKLISSLRSYFPLWRYYFWDLPLWTMGCRSHQRWSRMKLTFHDETENIRYSLQSFFKNKKTTVDLEQMVERALLIKVARNGDAFACLNLTPNNIGKKIKVSGLEHLQEAITQQRPIVLLTGHIGSFYTIPLILTQLGIKVNLLARTVDSSVNNPLPQQFFEKCNYFFTELKMSGSYLYTNFSNKLDKRLVTTCKTGGILLVLIDFPRRLVPSGRSSVQFLGEQSSLPVRTVELGVKYNAIFLTVWNTIETSSDFSSKRHLQVGPVIANTGGVKRISQAYADCLSEVIMQQPWQWMGASIINQFKENDLK
ncbi:MAG: hypothetical protein HOE45_08050 [Gammaproteobacteria bacterium]|nr:hypothetical protein [Gammaproteobacteria bacterium]